MQHSIFYILTIVILLIPLILIGFACRDEESEILPPPRPHPATIQLTAEDVGVTEVMLKISIAQDRYPRTFTLKRDTTIVLTTTLTSPDTLIFDEGLLPKHTYRYTLKRLKEQRREARQRREEIHNISVTTMDTTNHNFTWEVDTLGDGNSSVLYDVKIVNDTFVIVCGDINVRDSTGQWEAPYGAAIWNGNRWRLQRLIALSPGGYYSILRPRGVFAFSPTDIWFANAGVFHWNGRGDTVTPYWINSFPGNPNPILSPGQTAEKLWGTSSDDIFSIGNQGAIARFNGASWRKMESGTDVDLTDVWGSPDGSVVWACGYYYSKRGTYLLRFKPSEKWEIVYDGTSTEFVIRQDTISGTMTSLQVLNKRYVYIGTSAGIYKSPASTHGEGKRMSFTENFIPGFPVSMRCNGVNDITLVASHNIISHYNGVNWRQYTDLINPTGRLRSVAMKNNSIVAVGNSYDLFYGKGIVFRGRR